MRILLKLTLDCQPDAAWNAIRDPRILGQVSAPLMSFSSLEPDGFPASWTVGDHPVRVKLLGLFPLGTQVIGISFPKSAAGEQLMRDTGKALSGPLSVVTSWQHSFAVSAAPGGRTLYRDELRFSAGVFTAFMWPVYWAFWQWRAFQLKRLAPTW